MARFTILFAALLMVTGSVIAQDSEPDVPPTTAPPTTAPPTTAPPTTAPPTTTTSTTSTTSTTTSTEPTTTSSSTTTSTTTTEPTTTSSTTTSSTTTTTEATTTSTTEPTTSPTTPEPTTTPAPKPDSHIHYSVTNDNVTCVMIAGEVFINVNYTLNDNTTAIAKVFVPSANVEVDGSCNGTHGGQWISLTWGKNEVQMNFDTADKGSWTFTDLTATLNFDEENFPNATNAGKDLMVTVDYDLSPGEVSINHSFICRSALSSSNVTATMDKSIYSAPVTSTLKNIQIQAFNKIVNEKDFVDSVHCSADDVSDVVPIAVGCALAGLVVIVLIAYLVGRRRRSGAYQSV